ncbi:MAG: serine kinase, partial [Lentimicrobiaceae bacterium]|nr:serine kinase [Lentimicrobiaceae bacterium]
MNVRDLVEKANLKILSGEKGMEAEITGGYTCDLLSDVMGHAQEGNVWITLQTHKNVMAIASLKELAAIILVKNLQP